MSDNLRFICCVDTVIGNASENPLTVSFLLNECEVVPPTPIASETKIEFDVPDEDDKEWSLKIVIDGKTREHTILDEEFNVISDTMLVFKKFEFDGIDFTSFLYDNPWPYSHNFNGYGEDVVEPFVNTAGCNGVIEFKFTTPLYLWMLENI